MADPTPEEVAHAIDVLKALEASQEKAAEMEHESAQATAAVVPVDSEPVSPAAPIEPVAVDPYVARSPKPTATGHENPGPPFRIYK